MEQTNPQELLQFAKHLALESGSLLLAFFSKQREVSSKATHSDIVTDADRASEALIVSKIQERFPGHAILGEEGTGSLDILQEQGYVWIIDPLDGTVNYAQKLPIFAVSIGLLWQGKPLLGVVYLPVLKELFSAISGEGAFCNDEPIQVSQTTSLSDCVLATGFAYDKHKSNRDNVENFASMIKKVRGIRRMGAAAVDLSYVACGKLDGYWEDKLQPWDMAAGLILVQEAGGKVCHYGGGDISLHKPHIIATNGQIHETILQELQAYTEKHELL